MQYDPADKRRSLQNEANLKDLQKGEVRVECNEWQRHITTTKGNRIRYAPMTSRLLAALGPV